MLQADLVNFEKARFYSELAQKCPKKHPKKFDCLMLTPNERFQYTSYLKRDVHQLSHSQLVLFQKLYCKENIGYAIINGQFSTSLKFPVALTPEVKEWLHILGYYLTSSNEDIQHCDASLQPIEPPSANDSNTTFILRW